MVSWAQSFRQGGTKLQGSFTDDLGKAVSIGGQSAVKGVTLGLPELLSTPGKSPAQAALRRYQMQQMDQEIQATGQSMSGDAQAEMGASFIPGQDGQWIGGLGPVGIARALAFKTAQGAVPLAATAGAGIVGGLAGGPVGAIAGSSAVGAAMQAGSSMADNVQAIQQASDVDLRTGNPEYAAMRANGYTADQAKQLVMDRLSKAGPIASGAVTALADAVTGKLAGEAVGVVARSAAQRARNAAGRMLHSGIEEGVAEGTGSTAASVIDQATQQQSNSNKKVSILKAIDSGLNDAFSAAPFGAISGATQRGKNAAPRPIGPLTPAVSAALTGSVPPTMGPAMPFGGAPPSTGPGNVLPFGGRTPVHPNIAPGGAPMPGAAQGAPQAAPAQGPGVALPPAATGPGGPPGGPPGGGGVAPGVRVPATGLGSNAPVNPGRTGPGPAYVGPPTKAGKVAPGGPGTVLPSNIPAGGFRGPAFPGTGTTQQGPGTQLPPAAPASGPIAGMGATQPAVQGPPQLYTPDTSLPLNAQEKLVMERLQNEPNLSVAGKRYLAALQAKDAAAQPKAGPVTNKTMVNGRPVVNPDKLAELEAAYNKERGLPSPRERAARLGLKADGKPRPVTNPAKMAELEAGWNKEQGITPRSRALTVADKARGKGKSAVAGKGPISLFDHSKKNTTIPMALDGKGDKLTGLTAAEKGKLQASADRAPSQRKANGKDNSAAQQDLPLADQPRLPMDLPEGKAPGRKLGVKPPTEPRDNSAAQQGLPMQADAQLKGGKSTGALTEGDVIPKGKRAAKPVEKTGRQLSLGLKAPKEPKLGDQLQAEGKSRAKLVARVEPARRAAAEARAAKAKEDEAKAAAKAKEDEAKKVRLATKPKPRPAEAAKPAPVAAAAKKAPEPAKTATQPAPPIEAARKPGVKAAPKKQGSLGSKGEPSVDDFVTAALVKTRLKKSNPDIHDISEARLAHAVEVAARKLGVDADEHTRAEAAIQVLHDWVEAQPDMSVAGRMRDSTAKTHFLGDMIGERPTPPTTKVTKKQAESRMGRRVFLSGAAAAGAYAAFDHLTTKAAGPLKAKSGGKALPVSLKASPSTPKDMVQLAADIMRQFGITEKVMLIDPQDAAAWIKRNPELAKVDTGDGQTLGEIVTILQNKATVTGIHIVGEHNGEPFRAVIVGRGDATANSRMSTLAHEMAHVLMDTVMRGVKDTEAWGKIQEAAKNWAWEHRFDYRYEAGKSRKSHLSDYWQNENGPDAKDIPVQEGVLDGDAEEYLADQFSRYAFFGSEPDKPGRSLITRIMDKLKELFGFLIKDAVANPKRWNLDSEVARKLGTLDMTYAPDPLVEQMVEAFAQRNLDGPPVDYAAMIEDYANNEPPEPTDGTPPPPSKKPSYRKESLAGMARSMRDGTADVVARLKDPDQAQAILGFGMRRFLGALPFDTIEGWYSNLFKDRSGGGNLLRSYADAQQKIATTVRQQVDKAATFRREWLQEAQQDPQGHKDLESVMYRATYLQVDPRTTGTFKDPVLQAAADQLRQDFAALSPAMQRIYTQAHDFFHNQNKQVISELIRRTIDNVVKSLSIADPMHHNLSANRDSLVASIMAHGGINHLTPDQQLALDRSKRSITQLAQIIFKKDPYFPLRRYGDYVVSATISEKRTMSVAEAGKYQLDNPGAKLTDEGSGVYNIELKHTEFYESLSEAEAGRKDLVDSMPTARVEPVTKRDQWTQRVSQGGRASNALVEETLSQMKKSGVDPKVVAVLAQNMHHALNVIGPQKAFARAFAKRRGVAGASMDMMRALLTDANAAGYFYAHLKHGEEMTESLKAIKKRAEDLRKDPATRPADAQKAQDVANELYDRSQQVTGQLDTKGIEQFGGDVAAFYALSGFAYPIVNALQVLSTGLPIMAARFGLSKSVAAMQGVMKDITMGVLKSSMTQLKEVAKGKADDPMLAIFQDLQRAIRGSGKANANELADMVQALGDKGLVDQTFAIDVRHAMNVPSDRAMNPSAMDRVRHAGRWASDLTRIMPHAMEVLNRATVAMAAYQLAKEQGHNTTEATRIAEQAVRDSMFDYTSFNRSKWIKKLPMGQLLFMFKHYGLSMYGLVANNVRRSLSKDSTPEEKAIARKTLMGLFAAHAALGGVMGAVWEPAHIAYYLAGLLLGGGDDEDWNLERDGRRLLSDVMGPTMGELVGKGLPRALGIDLSTRISMANLLQPRQMQGTDRNATAAYVAEALLGPLASTGINFVDGMRKMDELGPMRAAEQMVPALARDVLKTGRMMTSFTTPNGDTIGRELNGLEALVSILGLTPARIAEANEQRSAIMEKKMAVESTRAALVRTYTTQPQLRGKTLPRITAFNREYPDYAITGDGLRASLKTKALQRKTIEAGVTGVKGKRTLQAAGAYVNLGR